MNMLKLRVVLIGCVLAVLVVGMVGSVSDGQTREFVILGPGDNNLPAPVPGILVDVEILNYLQTQLPAYSMVLEFYPWKRAFDMATNGEAGIFPLSKTEERLQIFEYSEAFNTDNIILVVLKGKEFPFQRIEDLKGKTLGISLGSSYGPEFERGKKEIFTVEENSGDPGSRLKKLLAERVDAVLVPSGKIELAYTIQQDPELLAQQENFVILPVPFLEASPHFIGWAKTMNNEAFRQEINAAIKKGIENGDIEKIKEAYYQKLLQPK
jgi:polar amino acid transport system substrate-binding protein